MFTTKIHEFVASGYTPSLADMLHKLVPKFIDALVDNKAVADEAKRLHQAAVNAMGMGS